jgi:hypothetical protein
LEDTKTTLAIKHSTLTRFREVSKKSLTNDEFLNELLDFWEKEHLTIEGGA